MPKLSERVIERLKSHAQKSFSHNKVVFFALHDEILEAMNDGCSLKAIWETLYEEKKINFKYRAFLRHAYQFADIAKKVEESSGGKMVEPKSQMVYSQKSKTFKKLPPKETKPNAVIKTFQHNPKSNLEDII